MCSIRRRSGSTKMREESIWISTKCRAKLPTWCVFGASRITHGFVSQCFCLVYTQVVQTAGIKIGEAMRKLGVTKHYNVLYDRSKRRLKKILRRRRLCFEALPHSQLLAMVKQSVGHTNGVGNSTKDVVDRLLELRVPVPQVSSGSPEKFLKTLYNFMEK